jgi:hypothetical protein
LCSFSLSLCAIGLPSSPSSHMSTSNVQRSSQLFCVHYTQVSSHLYEVSKLNKRGGVSTSIGTKPRGAGFALERYIVHAPAGLPVVLSEATLTFPQSLHMTVGQYCTGCNCLLLNL